MKSRGIQNLIYQLNSGIPPSEFSFSTNIAFVAQSVNAKLLEKINQLKKEHESEIKVKTDEIAKERNKCEELTKKLKKKQCAQQPKSKCRPSEFLLKAVS